MPGLVEGELTAVGVKVINANTANPDSGLPRASGLTVLFDVQTARPRCVMSAGHISALRTAAVSVLAGQLLLAPGAAIAAIMGAGALARHHCLLIAERLPQIQQMLIFDTVSERAEALCHDLAAHPSCGHVKFTVADQATTATAQADLLVACTTTRRPYIERQHLKAGAVAVNVSLDDLAADVLMTADKLYVDDWQLIAEDEHRLLGRLIREHRVVPADGNPTRPGERAVTGTVGQLVLGECPGRETDAELCVVNPFGLAVEDIALAYRVYLIARRAGLGTQLDF